MAARTTGQLPESEPPIHHVQAGWLVYDRVGRRVGQVIKRENGSVLIARDVALGAEARVRIELIADENTDGRWVTLSVAARDLDQARDES